MSSMPVCDTPFEPWDGTGTYSIDGYQEPLYDLELGWGCINESGHTVLVITSDNMFQYIPGRVEEGNTFRIVRRSKFRSPVIVDSHDISNANGAFKNFVYDGRRRDILGVKNRSGYAVRKPHIRRITCVERKPRLLDQEDWYDTLDEICRIDLTALNFNQPVYVAQINVAIVKVKGEYKSADHVTKGIDHPYIATCARSLTGKPEGFRILGTQLTIHWTPPDFHNPYSLWVNVLGKAFEIKPTNGAGAPGMLVTFGNNDSVFVPVEDLEKEMWKYNVFPTRESALHWRDPIQKEAYKNDFDQRSYERKSSEETLKGVMAEMRRMADEHKDVIERMQETHRAEAKLRDEQHRAEMKRQDELRRQMQDDHLAELKRRDEDAKRKHEELIAEMRRRDEDAKRKHEEFAAEIRRRDEEAKRQREAEEARRQRNVDVWKAAASITAAVVGIGMTFFKILEKASSKK
ncbi:hypothetical protein DST30_24050 [Salmonella enterica subsp. enterica serovar Panama]|nr:hypothetical protein [Salmonella enterica subsp. enterica serovar Panama]